MRKMKRAKIIFGLILSLFVITLFTKPVLGAQIEAFKKRFLEVLVMNDESKPVPVIVQNQPIPLPTQGQQLWEHWYQCHPNPTNEAEIRGYLNDRGREGWEVVAAAGPGNIICEYYKRPLSP